MRAVVPDSLSPCESLASKNNAVLVSSLTLFEILFEMFQRTDSNFFRIGSMLVDRTAANCETNSTVRGRSFLFQRQSSTAVIKPGREMRKWGNEEMEN